MSAASRLEKLLDYEMVEPTMAGSSMPEYRAVWKPGAEPKAADVASVVDGYLSAQRQIKDLMAAADLARRVIFGKMTDEQIETMLAGLGVYVGD